MKLSQAIQLIENSPSSIFTKEDVLEIINNLDADSNSASFDKLSESQIATIANEVSSAIENSLNDWTELDSVTVSVGNYGNGVDDVNFTVDTDRIKDVVTEVLEEFFSKNEEEEDCK